MYKLDLIKSRLGTTGKKKWIQRHAVETVKNEAERERLKKRKKSIRDFWDNKSCLICV